MGSLSEDLYIGSNLGVIIVMRDFYSHGGAGRSQADRNACCMIEATEGAVFEILERHGNVEFVVGFCRKALADRWGICCIEPFRRVSDPGLTRTWAVRSSTALQFFRSARLRLIREQEWMQRTN